MYCPNPDCIDRQEEGVAGEYVAGIDLCPKCGATLVPTNPVPPTEEPELDPEVEVATVFVTADATEAAVVRSLLEASAIPYAVNGLADHEILGLAGAGVGIAGQGGLAFQVRVQDLEEARALLEAEVGGEVELEAGDDLE